MTKLGFITFDEKLEAAWGLHKIEKAVLEKEIAELRAENEKLRREAAIRIDQIEREQEAHLKTMADLAAVIRESGE